MSIGLRPILRRDVGGADRAQHLPPAVAVDADGDDHRDRDDMAVLTDLHVGRVEPEIGPVAFNRPLEEGVHPLIDLLAQPADLALGDAGHAHGLDQLVDRARRDALDVGLLDDGGESLLRQASGLEEAREAGALPELGDAKLDRAGTGLPVSAPIPVALRQSLRVLPAVGSAGQLADLKLHRGRRVAKPIISRSRSASADFPISPRRLIISSVIGGLSVRVGVATRSYRHRR
jgi:hypothetical protein